MMFALYPAIFLYAANSRIVDFSVVFIPATLLILFALAVWGLLSRVLGDSDMAAVLTSLPIFAFFSYGAVERALTSSDAGVWPLLVSGSVVAACGAALALLKWKQFLAPTNYMLNVISLLLAASPMFQSALWNYGAFATRDLLPDRAQFEQNPLEGKGFENAPDIYYLVLDGYGRSDVLLSDYGFDNAEMISELRDRGFYVADEATANYPFTAASVTSALNLEYLQNLLGEELSFSTDRRFLRELLGESRTTRLLRSVGYSIVSFGSEYAEAQVGPVDVDMNPWWFPSQYAQAMALMTPIPSALAALGQPGLYDLHRYRTLYPFERLGDTVSLEGPKFVYAHIFFGHPPFVFGAEGEPISAGADYTWNDGSRLLEEDNDQRREYVEGYNSQITYLNSRLKRTIDEIIARSETPPIILIHGDHGPGARYDTESLENTDVRERFGIFFAALLPDGGSEDLYSSISPVNGMRIVFNRYFDTEFPLLDDVRYFSPTLTPYEFRLVDSDGLQATRR